MNVIQILQTLKKMGSREVIEYKAKKFGVICQNSYGIYQKDLKAFAKDIPPLEIAILEIDHKAARWIAKNALRELEGPKVYVLNYPRAQYGAPDRRK